MSAADNTSPVAPATQADSPLASIAQKVGIAGLVIAAVGLLMDPVRGGQSWLLGYAFWFAILVGCLFLVQISYIFDAGWSTIVRRQWEHALAAFPWMFLLLLPLLLVAVVGTWFNWEPLWQWMDKDYTLIGDHPVQVGEDVLYLKKGAYLNVPFFLVRVVGYFAVFCGLSFLLRYFSTENDLYPTVGNYRGGRITSGLGIFLTAGAMTFMAFDLFMSLSYHWFSTMYGVWFFAASMRAALAFTVIICFFLGSRGYLRGIISPSHFYYLGCVKLAFTVFWAYIVFSQFFLIYNANIPEETFWFNMRQLTVDGDLSSWWYVGLTLLLGNFIVPFIYLLWNRSKVVPGRLLFISVWILVFTLADHYYNILPRKIPAEGTEFGYAIQQFVPSPFDLAALVGIGGIVIWAMLRSMKRHEPIPIRDPRIQESIHCSH